MSGKVVDGKIELDDGLPSLEEGLAVAVLAPETPDRVILTETEEEELLAANREYESGNWVSGEELLSELRAK